MILYIYIYIYISIFYFIFCSIVINQTKKLIDVDDVNIHIEGIGFKLEARN
jgi:hypothetical protein